MQLIRPETATAKRLGFDLKELLTQSLHAECICLFQTLSAIATRLKQWTQKGKNSSDVKSGKNRRYCRRLRL